MYDNTCKFLVEKFFKDFATWLFVKPIELTKLEPSELASDPILADSVILLESTEIIVHLEFQTKTDDTMAYRMANYWLRLYGKYPNREIHRTVIYLKQTNAVLTKTTNPEATLQDIAKLIDKIEDQKAKSDVAAATSIISGSALNKEIL